MCAKTTQSKYCCVLQCVTVCYSVLQCVTVCCNVLQRVAACCSAMQCDAVCCSVLQCVAVCCSVLQQLVVCCSMGTLRRTRYNEAHVHPKPILKKKAVHSKKSLHKCLVFACTNGRPEFFSRSSPPRTAPRAQLSQEKANDLPPIKICHNKDI